jgi:hypothetical protein
VITVEWLEETAARWARTMAAAGDGGVPLDEAVRLVAEVGALDEPEKGKRRRKRRGREVSEPVAVAALSRCLIVATLAGDRLLDRLAEATGRTREELLAELSVDPELQVSDERLRLMRQDTAAAAYLAEAPTYSGLGERVEQVLRLAEEQATELVEAAREEAARIRRCPHCGQDVTH